VIVAQTGVPIQITFRNNLPPTHIIPVDITLAGANQAQNRASVHLHGGFTPRISDGGPFDWFAPDGSHGPSFLNNSILNPGAALNEAEYYYTNDQSARLVWYHDHAVGITRINAYAGIASAYVIRDSFEGDLRNLGLPDFVENAGREIPNELGHYFGMDENQLKDV
jgi:spore coat protein A, manganese oxidase